MSERKFARVKGKVGTAAQVRETVSKHVRSKTIYQNKSLLVDCTLETEYSTKKYFELKRVSNRSHGFENDSSSDVVDDLEDNCNLFVRECLKTYSTAFLEVDDDVEDAQLKINYNEKPKPKHLKTDSFLYNGNNHNVPESIRIESSNKSTNETNSAKAPSWFWNIWAQSRGVQLDEAGIAIEGRVGVIFKEEDLDDRYVQIKWDESEEKFNLIVWALDAGREYVCKIDLSSANPVWNGEHRLNITETLIVHSEQKRGFLRDIYTICAELGCYEKSASLASRLNVDRVLHVIQLFQRAATLGVLKNGRSWTKVRIKTDLPSENGNNKTQNKSSGKFLFEPLPTFFAVRLDSIEFRLKTEIGTPIEPYYLSVSLWDVKNGRKISEDFHTTLDINGKLVGNHKAVFKVSESNEQIFVVLRVEKTLQATDYDAYLRGNPDLKNGTRISKSIISSPLFTDQRYRMPLCWSARCLFKKSGSIAAEGTGFILDSESTFSPFYKYEKYTEEELIKTLSEIKKPEKVAKLTPIPGTLKIHVESMKPDELAVAETKENCSSSLIIEFPINSCDNFSRFIHLLYVYPLSLNLNAVAGKIRARNILCRVFLRAEDDIEASPLDQSPVSGSISSYVLHHRSNPDWYSEIKLSLPVALDPRLHLLFQFFHISCSFDKTNKTKQVENVIGYAWIPLLNKYRFIGGEHTLPVAASLPSGYLQIQPLGLGKGSLSDDEVRAERSSIHGGLPQLLQISRKNKRHVFSQYSGPDIAWLDSKCTLTVKLNLISTVWTKCGSLGAFFAHSEKYFQKSHASGKFHCDDETTIKMLRTLETMDLPTLRDFFPTIMNQICHIAGTSKTVGTAALKFMIFAFHTLIEADLESIIEQYVRSRFLSAYDEDIIQTKVKECTMSEVLADSWIHLFETGDGATIASSLEHSRNLFSMIIKSLAVEGIQCTSNPEDSKLVKLIQLFTSEIVKRCESDHGLSKGANENCVSFVSALISVVSERHIVFAGINAYLACFGPGDSHKVQNFKFSLLQCLVEHPLFLELNSADGDDEFSRLESAQWCKRHFLAATVMKQCRSGLGEVQGVRSLALKPIMIGLARHEINECVHPMWIPWLRVVCDNLHRIMKIVPSHSSRCSSVSTVLSATTSTLVHQALSKSISGQGHEGHNHGANCQQFSREGSHVANSLHRHPLLGTESCSSLSLNVPNGMSPSISHNSSMVSINNIGTVKSNGSSDGSGDRMSIDRMSFSSVSNCDYLDAISAIKTSNPAASSIVPSTTGSDAETIVNEEISNGSGETQSIIKEPSDEGDADSQSMKRLTATTVNTDMDKSNVVLRRYDKLTDIETSQLLVSGLYILKTMGNDRLRLFWNRSNSQERASLLQMVHLACVHFTNARKNSTITKTKVVGITVPPTMPPSPRSTAVPNKKWSSLPSKPNSEDSVDGAAPVSPQKGSRASPFEAINEWKTLNTEVTFVCVDTLSNLCGACKGENNEMREVIRTTLDVAKAAEDTRAMLGALENLYKIEELPLIVFAKGNEDLTHLLFCELLNGFGTSYLIHICVLILGKLFIFDPNRATSQCLLAIPSLSLDQVFVHNFRKALNLLEKTMSVNDRSSFLLSITENLSFIDVTDSDSSRPGNYSSSNTLISKSLSKSHMNGTTRQNKLQKSASTFAMDLSSRLATVINSVWVLRSCANDYRISELFLKLANSYAHFANARLRIEAFDSLKIEHLNKKRYSEALLCELHIAARLARQTATPEARRIMLGISENLRDEFETLDESLEEEEYTEELIQRLETCVNFCEKSERYELMLEVYRILVDIQESCSDYAALEHSYKQMSRACKLIQNKRERFHGTYYRVALFHPKKHSTSRPMEVFIYKEPNVTSLNEICGKVESSENAIIISGEVYQLPDDEKLYATITHVSPLPSNSPRRKLWSEEFRRHQNVQKFTYDTPFAVKSHDKISIDNKAAVHQQWKRRTTVTTEYTFPAVVSRLRVVQSVEEDLSPIIVAIDDMQRRVTELRSELDSHDIKRIQLRLQGSISVQVNQGPLAYARAFLEKENEHPSQDIHKLKAIYRDFIECCRELLIKNGAMIDHNQVDYQNQLESDFATLCQVLSPYLGLPELIGLSLNRMSRVSVNSY